jgi:diguanylate cyclase (GGDEF)-like protein
VTDASLPDGIDLSIVDETVASGLRLLKFPPRLEAAFERETSRQRCRQLAVGAFIGLAMYNLALVNDWLVTPDIFITALWVRLGFMMPIFLVLTARLFFNPPVFLREGGVAVGTILAVASSLYLMLASADPFRESQFQYIILAILYATVVQRARFAYAIATCLGCLALYAYAQLYLPGHSLKLAVSANLIFGGAVFMALFGAYMLEREQRLNYLLSLRGRLQNRVLDAISRHDPLTGLGNRRSLDEALARWERDPGAAEELSLLLFDIDHFKLFNDAAGHQAGDACLKRVAGVIRGQLRDHTDHAFRFGGEEFLVMLRATDLPAAIGIAERMRRAIEEAAIPHPAAAAGAVVTASFGVACAMSGQDIHAQDIIHAAEIIADADAALYAAKRNGRNQVWPRLPSARRSEIIDLPDRKSRAR